MVQEWSPTFFPQTGRNVAAGMTGGLGYFLDEEGDFEDRVNAEIVTVQPVRTSAGEAQLRALIQDHVDRTGAPRFTSRPASAPVSTVDIKFHQGASALQCWKLLGSVWRICCLAEACGCFAAMCKPSGVDVLSAATSELAGASAACEMLTLPRPCNRRL